MSLPALLRRATNITVGQTVQFCPICTKNTYKISYDDSGRGLKGIRLQFPAVAATLIEGEPVNVPADDDYGLDRPAAALTEDAAVYICDLLDEIYALVAAGRVPAAMDVVIGRIGSLLNSGPAGVRTCNHLLQAVSFKRLPSNVRRAFLAVTRPVKRELPARAVVYQTALALLSAERGAETAAKMLSPLA